ncbi:MAG: hypothetical protein HYV27_07470 [Candidatus Hydrogenedentes bacterium]|nr:hypothetical protein [Candidatus Hydrogenedentota bacterium]
MADWFTHHLGWMYWTWQSALFFGAIMASIAVLTVLDLRQPSVPRKGWLPIPTTRGDRLFLAIMSAIGLHLLWLGLAGAAWVAGASVLSAFLAVAIFWKG